MIETDSYPLVQGLQKYLSTDIEISRGTVKIMVPGNQSRFRHQRTECLAVNRGDIDAATRQITKYT